jgi:hypothetical protein
VTISAALALAGSSAIVIAAKSIKNIRMVASP